MCEIVFKAKTFKGLAELKVCDVINVLEILKCFYLYVNNITKSILFIVEILIFSFSIIL